MFAPFVFSMLVAFSGSSQQPNLSGRWIALVDDNAAALKTGLMAPIKLNRMTITQNAESFTVETPMRRLTVRIGGSPTTHVGPSGWGEAETTAVWVGARLMVTTVSNGIRSTTFYAVRGDTLSATFEYDGVPRRTVDTVYRRELSFIAGATAPIPQANTIGHGAGFVIAALAFLGGPQVPLSKLTVPETALPKGCKLASDLSGAVRDNPWIGNNPYVVVSIRDNVDGPPPASVPPGPASVARTAEHVIEGYRADYVAADGGAITVWALRFVDEKWTAAAVMRGLTGEVPRIIIGPIAVRVALFPPRVNKRPTGSSASSGQACYDAIRKYILSVSQGPETAV